MPGIISPAFLFAVRMAMLLRNKNLLICVEVPACRWKDFDALQSASSSRSEKGGALMFYQLYELSHAAMAPYRAFADVMRLAYANPLNPLAQTPWGRTMAASFEMFERTTRRYGKPPFALKETVIG